jgi:KaiC/GvpD/RAD55 family RecA-like ATPase
MNIEKNKWDEFLGNDDVEDTLKDNDINETKTPVIPPGNMGQHILLSYLLSNSEAWTIVEPILKPDYFVDEFKPVIRFILDHVREYKILPSIHTTLMKTGKRLEKYDDATDARTTNWLINETEEFCRHSATLLEIQRAYEIVSHDKRREVVEEIYQNIKAITEISVNKDLGIEVHLDARTQLDKPPSVSKEPCGYQHMDRALNGGLPCPGMLMISGRSGYGKSVNLANFGIQYCEQDKFVVYITLEMHQDRVFDRVAAMMSDIPARSIRTEKIKVGDELEYRLEMGNDGLYVIKKFPQTGTTVSHLNAYLKELTIKMNRTPKVFILDYIQCLWPRTKIRDMGDIHIKDKYCVEELYDLCTDWNMLCLTASQLIKNHKEHDMTDQAIVAGGTPLMNTTDVALTFERKDDVVSFYIVKGRDGGEGIVVPMLTNIDTLRLRDAPDELFYERNPRLNPNFASTEHRKIVAKEKTSINKDMQSYQNDDIISRIIKLHDEDNL